MATSRLRGQKELNARLRAIKQSFKPIGRKWGRETVNLARPQVPSRTGATRRTLRLKRATMKRATVTGNYVAGFLDQGTGPHEIAPRRARRLVFQSGGATIFARKVHHRGIRALRFGQRAGREALRRVPAAEAIIREWNRAG